MFTPPSPAASPRLFNSTSEKARIPDASRQVFGPAWSVEFRHCQLKYIRRWLHKRYSSISHTSKDDLMLQVVCFLSVLVKFTAASGFQPLPMRSCLCHCAR